MVIYRRWTEADYATPEWRKVRAEAAGRSGGLCQCCGFAPGTDGHHLEYRAPEYMKSDMVTWLCPLCHELATEIRRLVGVEATSLLLPHAQVRAVFAKLAPHWAGELRAALATLSPGPIKGIADQPANRILRG